MEQVKTEVLSSDVIQFNDQQIRMIELFRNPWPEEDYSEVRDLIVKILAKRIDEQMEQLAKEREWTQETYEGWRKEHMRTPYHNPL